MTDQTNVEQPVQQSVSPFGELVGKLPATLAPDMVKSLILAPLEAARTLIIAHNQMVMRIKESQRALDPNNTEIVDSKWANAIEAGTAPAEIVAAEKEYDELRARCEVLLTEILRPFGKSLIESPLNETEIADARKSVNENKKNITEAIAGAGSMATMADGLLTAAGLAIEGGILSLMPEPTPLVGGGRKSSGSSGAGKGPYATRLNGLTVNGETIESDSPTKFWVAAAEFLNREFNSKALPQNEVTAERIESAMYTKRGLEFRSSELWKDVAAGAIDFTISFDVHKQNANDEGTTIAPVIINFVAERFVKGTGGEVVETAPANTADVTPDQDSDNSAPVNEGPANTNMDGGGEGDNSEAPVAIGPATAALVAKAEGQKSAAEILKARKERNQK